MADQIIIELIGDPSGLKPAEEALKELSKASEENIEAFNKANEAAKKFAEAAADAAKGARAVADGGKDAGKELEGVADATGKSITAMSNLNSVIAAGAVRTISAEFRTWSTEVTTLTATKRQLQTALQSTTERMESMRSSSQRVTVEYVQLQLRAQSLRTQIDQTNQSIQENTTRLNQNRSAHEQAGNETENTKGRLAGFLGTIGGGVKALKDYTDKVGDLISHSKALANSVAEVGEAYAEATGNEELSVEIKKKTASALQALATVESVLTLATEGATVAAVALDVAMSPITGIVLLVAAGVAAMAAQLYVAYKAFEVVINMVKNTAWFKAAAAGFHMIENAVTHIIERLRDYASILTGGMIDSTAVHKHKLELDSIASAHEASSKALKEQIDLMQAAGVKSSEIADKRKQQLKDEETALQNRLILEENFEKKEEIRNKLNEVHASQLKNQLDIVESIAADSKEAGENEVTIAANRQKSYEILLNEVAATIQRLKNIQNMTEAEKKELEQAEIAYQGLTNKKEQADKDYADKSIAAWQKATSEHLAFEKQKADAKLAIAKAGSLAELDAKINDINAAAAIEINSVKGYSKEAEQLRKDIREKAQQDADNAAAEFRTRSIENKKTELEGQLIEVEKGSRQEYDIKLGILAKERDLIDMNTRMSAEQKAKARKEIDKKEEEADADFYSRKLQSEINTQKDIDQVKLLKLKEYSADALAVKKEMIELELKAELAAIEAGDKSREEKEAASHLARANANKKIEQDASDFAIHQSDTILKTHQETNNKIIESLDGVKGKEKEVFKLEIDNIEKEKDANEELHKTNAITDEEYAKRSEEIEKKLNAKKKQLHQEESKEAEAAAKKKQEIEKKVGQEILKMAKEVSNAIFENEAQARQNAMKAQTDHLGAMQQAELSNKSLTEAQKQAIQQKYKRQEAALKLKEWKADQKAKEEQAIINGLLAFTTALTAVPYPEGLIPAFLALAQAGVQAGIIAAKTPPTFATGTPGAMVTPEGFKWVGEKGPELIYTPGGEKIMTNADSMAFLEKYRIPAMPSVDHLLQGTGVHIAGREMDYDRLSQSMAKAISGNIKQLHVNVDETGFSKHIISRNNRIQSYNNRYKF